MPVVRDFPVITTPFCASDAQQVHEQQRRMRNADGANVSRIFKGCCRRSSQCSRPDRDEC